MIWLVLLIAVAFAWRIPLIRICGGIGAIWLGFNWATYTFLGIDCGWNHSHFMEKSDEDHHLLGFSLMESLEDCRHSAGDLRWEFKRFPTYDHPSFTCWYMKMSPGDSMIYLLEFRDQWCGTRLWRMTLWEVDYRQTNRCVRSRSYPEIVHGQYDALRPDWTRYPEHASFNFESSGHEDDEYVKQGVP
jgi:hypothetical protein